MTSVGVVEALEDVVDDLRLFAAVLLLLFEVGLVGFVEGLVVEVSWGGGGMSTLMAASMTSTPVATSCGERAARSQRLAVSVATKAASCGVRRRPWKAARRHEMARRGREAAQYAWSVAIIDRKVSVGRRLHS